MKEKLALLVMEGFRSIHSDLKQEHSKIRKVFGSILRYPIKVIGLFIFSPILLSIIIFRIAKQKDPGSLIRVAIAVFGFVLATVLAYIAGTAIGSLGGALFIASNIGILTGIGFFLGTTISIYLTVAFQILVFNFFTTVFLKMTHIEVLDYFKDVVGITEQSPSLFKV